MNSDQIELAAVQQLLLTQRTIERGIRETFAPEDAALSYALAAAQKAGLPEIQISPAQGKLLQLFAATCNAQRILEIGALAGYSGLWLARSLPADGRLITLEISPEHANVVRDVFANAGVSERSEIRVGKALDLLPQLEQEQPFDLIFIDADKPPYLQYLEWALRLIRPGGIIIADNCIRRGAGFYPPDDEGAQAIASYNRRVASDPRLVALALNMDDDYTDGFTVAVVKR